MAIYCCNSSYLTDLPVANVDPSICISPESKAPLKQIILSLAGSESQKYLIVFVGGSQQVNADIYQDLLWQRVIPWVQRMYPYNNYVFQQDLVLADNARTTQEFLRETMADF